jgi:hypothetical protein
MWIWLIGVPLALLGLDRLLLWMETKGWVYWRRTRRSRPRGGGYMTPLSGMFDPGANYLAEAFEERVLEEQESGDGTGKRRRTDHGLTPPATIRIPRGGPRSS